MKQIIVFTFGILLLQSCIVNHQVFEVNSGNTKEVNKTLVYENDTIRITYNFWSDDGGVLEYEVYNKSKKPIYINWSKSNFIYNGVSQDYYQNKEVVKSQFNNTQYNTRIGSYGVVKGSSISTKEKLAVQIPPSSLISVKRFNLNHGWIKEKRNKKESLTTINLGKDNTTLFFRNYLAFSFDSEYKNEFFIDNDFWIDKVYLLKGKTYTNGDFPYKKNKQFHLVNKNSAPAAIAFLGGTILGVVLIIVGAN